MTGDPIRSTSRFRLALIALIALALVPLAPHAATPGLPFTEDFADAALKDPSRTTAAWTTSGVAFAARTRRFGSFAPLQGLGFSPGGYVLAMAAGDVDGDGDLDLVFGNVETPSYLFLNDGSATPFNGTAGSPITADSSLARSTALGDLDRDGDLDLVVGNGGTPDRLYFNNGSASPFGGIAGLNLSTDSLETTAIALGDVDRDGDLDVVVGRYDSPNRLHLNNGTANPFGGVAGIDLTGDNLGTTSVALGDLDADGDLDLVAGNGGGAGFPSPRNRLYLNNGTASPFAGVTGSDITSDGFPTTSVVVGDMDGDGDLDLVAGNRFTSNRLYLNNGTAAPFNGVTGSSITSPLEDTSTLALGDVDGDGDLDLLAGTSGTANLLCLNNGTSFPFAGVTCAPIPPDTIAAHTAVAIADLNGDDALDILIARAPLAAFLYFNNGVANPFARDAGQQVTPDLSNSWHRMAMGDVDGDGDRDLVVANDGQTNRLYLNNGSADPFAGVAGSDITADVLTSLGVALGDLDGDGDLDLVVGNIDHANRVYLNNGTADPFAGVAGTDIPGPLRLTMSVALGDLDGDGDLDLAVGNNEGPNRLHLNNGTNTPFGAGSDITADDAGTTSVALGDMDGDGDLDVVTGNFIGGLANRLYLNNGTANPFLGVAGSDVTSDTAGGVNDVTLADVDRDGDLDVVTGRQFMPPRFYLNNGTTIPFAGVTGGDIAADFLNTKAIVSGDVDHDGDIDIVTGNFGGSRLYLNTGTANPFAGVAGMDIGAAAPLTMTVALGDVDGDGDPDLVAGNYQQPHRLFRGLASPTPANRYSRVDIGTDAPTSWCSTLGDVDGDGDLDLVVGNLLGARIRLYPGNGSEDPWSGTSGSDVSVDGNATASVALGDVDSDGDLDLVAGNVGASNRLYLNNGTTNPFAGVSGVDIAPEVRNTRAVALADMDGDGDLDVVAANQNSTSRLYLNNGTANPFAGVTGSDITSYAATTITMAVGDVDGDGDFDVVTGQISEPLRLTLNNGTATPFSGVTGSNVSSEATLTFSVALGDMDGDGDLDIVAGKAGNPSRLYLNNGGSDPFGGVAGSTITNDANSLYSIALGDLDGDGDLDVAAGRDGEPNRLYLNNGGADPFAGIAGRNLTDDIGATRAVALGDADRDGRLDLVTVGSEEPARLYRGIVGHAPLSRAISLAVDDTTELIQGATLGVVESLPANTAIDYWLSNNGGARWYLARPGRTFMFPTTGSDLRWRAELGSLAPLLSPLLHQVHLDQARTPGDRVWQDLDGDGVQGAGEVGMPGITVSLYDAGGVLVGSRLTDANGFYRVPASIAAGAGFRLRFSVPSDHVMTPADQGGDDTLDSDADPSTSQTPVALMSGDLDQTRWDAGMYPACMPPDTAVVITSIVSTLPEGYSLLHFTDANWRSRVTGYNVRRSTDASLPKPSWPLIATNIDDQDLATPGKQWVDTSGNPPVGVVWFYEVAAYNDRCPAEGPY